MGVRGPFAQIAHKSNPPPPKNTHPLVHCYTTLNLYTGEKSGLSLYENGEIDIHPEFQRFYRWTDIQKSNLIESIFLGIPIPPIFVSQRKDGVWDVIDGLQRLSTIYQFAGVLKDESGKDMDPLVLEKTKYLPSLEGRKWDDPSNPNTTARSCHNLSGIHEFN